VAVPVYGLTGLVDPVVPWCVVWPWLRRNCPTLRAYKVIWQADHNVLGTGFRPASAQLLRWMNES
jgi:hypothetical protein